METCVTSTPTQPCKFLRFIHIFLKTLFVFPFAVECNKGRLVILPFIIFSNLKYMVILQIRMIILQIILIWRITIHLIRENCKWKNYQSALITLKRKRKHKQGFLECTFHTWRMTFYGIITVWHEIGGSEYLVSGTQCSQSDSQEKKFYRKYFIIVTPSNTILFKYFKGDK